MQLVERAKAAQTIGKLDLQRYMNREEMSRVIPASAIAEECRSRILLGRSSDVPGLLLPWQKANGRVRIEPAMLAVWCGWSFHGKSQMLKQLMVHAMAEGERVCIASMEEKVRDIWIRMAKIATAENEPSVRDVDAWIEFSKSLWFYDQQGRVKADIIKAVIRYAAEELGVTQFVIDSLMMLAIAKDDYDGQNKLVGDLHSIAADTGCTIHLVAHMKKSDGKGEEQPGTSHSIAGGHEIASIADYVFNVWRDKKKLGDYPAVLTIEKQRGEIDWIGALGLGYDEVSRQFTEGRARKYVGNAA